GGAGDSLLGTARAAGVDVFLTADLRHHPASEFVEEGGPALIDAAHWATEWPWLDSAASILGSSGVTVETRVSATVTDAWTRGYSS
uniref:Nif3-like dinuclear metal center hexameric protein n=1 Tax=Nonomuraea rhizosphaerae TaxID=2665663 RepID=UPI001C5CFB71